MGRSEKFHACMKKGVLFFVLLAVAFIPTQAIYAQIPVTDAGQINQSILNTAKEIEQMLKQIEEMKKQYDAVTGSYGRGVQGLDDAINAAKNIPGSWQDIVNQQSNGVFNEYSQKYEDVLKPLPQEKFEEGSRVGKSYEMSSNAVIASFAGAEIIHEEIQTHLTNLETLAKQIDSTINIKDAQDLQNRIASEQALIQTAMGKMGTLQMNLQGNLVNQQLQAESQHKEYYEWKGPGRVFSSNGSDE